MSDTDLIEVSLQDAEALWLAWARDDDDLLAHAAFERTLRWVAGLQDEGLYFRPGGWTVGLSPALARLACAAAILAAGFQVAGLEDLDRELIIAAAAAVSAMEVRAVRLGREEEFLLERIRTRGLDGTSLSAKQARKALPKSMRPHVSRADVADALDRLVAAGVADADGPGTYVVRAAGSEAFLRVSLD